MAREPVHDALAHGRQEAAEQRMVLGEAAAPAHGGYIDARLVAFGQGLDGLEGLAAVHGRSDHEGRCARTLQRLAYAVQQAWVGSGFEADFAQRDGLAGHIPVIGGNGDEDRAARLLHGDVVGARQGLGHVLGACGLAAPLHIGLGQLGGLVGVQEGVELQQRAGLLAGRDDHGRAVLEGREDIGHGVAHAGGRVQVHEAGIARGLGIAVCHAHDHGFLQAEDVREVLGIVAKQGQLGGARVAEDARHAQLAQHVDDGVAYGEDLGGLGIGGGVGGQKILLGSGWHWALALLASILPLEIISSN